MAPRIDKQSLLDQLCESLVEEVERATRHARDAAEATTHEENRAEGDKDMRSTETSYVARGQALRARDLELSLRRLRLVEVRAFAAGAAIETSALIDVEQDGEKITYFLVPAGGGQLLRAGSRDIHALATTSPLGRGLLGLAAGEEAEVATPQGARTVTVLAVR